MRTPVKLRIRPAHVREVLDYHAIHSWNATLAHYQLHGRTMSRWLQLRAEHGPEWPTQAEDDAWVATLEARQKQAAKLRRYRTRSCYGARKLMVDSTGTRRRIQALHALGWRAVDIAERGPWNAKEAVYELTRRAKVTVRNAESIARIYDDMCMTLGPSADTRRRAKKAGWPPPLAYDDIDDIEETPDCGYLAPTRRAADGGFAAQDRDDVDDVVVTRILAGDWRLAATVAEKRIIVAQWPGTLVELERLTGWRTERYVTREDDVA